MNSKLFCCVLAMFFAPCCFANEAQFRLAFSGHWNLKPLPGNAHFTSIVGATHAKPDEIFAIGGLATQGVENVAEIGSPNALVIEINNKIAEGAVGSLVLRPGNIGPEQNIVFDIVVDADHPHLSLLTMIAPSPDWFVGLNSLNLRADGEWIEEITMTLNSYDAGTEQGANFSLTNPATNPQDIIRALDVAEPSNPLFGFGAISSLTISRVVDADLGTGDVNLDGFVNKLDVAPFVEVLMSAEYQVEADINCDGSVDLFDVQPFVELMTN